jgi:hypothetical protein
MSYASFDKGPKTRGYIPCIQYENLVTTSFHISLKDSYNFVKQGKCTEKITQIQNPNHIEYWILHKVIISNNFGCLFFYFSSRFVCQFHAEAAIIIQTLAQSVYK